MQLNEIKPVHGHKDKKRIGRGGKRGTTSGRGTKGQKSRSGHRIRPAERDLILRMPKLRGIKNKSLVEKTKVLNLSNLESMKDSVVTIETLKNAGILTRRFTGSLKVVGKGDIKKALKLQGIKTSEGVKAIIEKAGGSVEL